MNNSLRVKEYEKEKESKQLAVRISENQTPLTQSENRRKIVFREMWANAFIHKKGELAEQTDVSIKKKVPSPYVYLRIAALYVIAIVILLSVFYFFDFHELYPIICLLIATFVPFVCLIFFYELDTNLKIGIGMTVFLFFISAGIFLAIRFFCVKFVISVSGYVTLLEGLISGGAEIVFTLLFTILMVKSLKIRDVVTGCYLGAVVGAAFAVINNIVLFFDNSYMQPEIGYVLGISASGNKYSFADIFNKMIVSVLWDCIPRSFATVLTGCILGSLSVYIRVSDTKKYIIALYFVTIVVAAIGFNSVWHANDISSTEYVIYGLRIVHIILAVIVALKLIRFGLARNKYET